MKIQKTKNIWLFGSFLLFALTLTGANPVGNHQAEGKIVKVEPAEREIYVYSQGEKLEYYFNKDTEVSEKGEARKYEDLKEGQSVRVSSKKIGRRLDPLKVEILD